MDSSSGRAKGWNSTKMGKTVEKGNKEVYRFMEMQWIIIIFIIGKQHSKIKQLKIPHYQTWCALVDPTFKIFRVCPNIGEPVRFSLIKLQTTTISPRKTGIFYYQKILNILFNSKSKSNQLLLNCSQSEAGAGPGTGPPELQSSAVVGSQQGGKTDSTQNQSTQKRYFTMEKNQYQNLFCSPSAAVGGATQRKDNSTEIVTPYCDICKLPFRTLTGLLSHLKGKPHIKKASEAAELQSQSLHNDDEWICGTCRETFQTEDSLTIHQLTECKEN